MNVYKSIVDAPDTSTFQTKLMNTFAEFHKTHSCSWRENKLQIYVSNLLLQIQW